MASAKALTALRIEKLTSEAQGRIGWYRDAAGEDGVRGLYLQITRLREINRPAAACWVLRYTKNGKQRYHGLGSLSEFSVAEARERARDVRKQIRDGLDPVAKRKADKAAAALEAVKAITFEQAAEEFYRRKHKEWKSPVHRQQFTSTMETYVYPVLGKVAVADVDRELVLRVLEPHWETKTETMSRTRQRIEAVLSMAMQLGYRPQGLNPAIWKGGLDKILARPSKIAKVEHHAAMPFAEVPAFMRALRKRPGFAARALELTVLCATRTSETLLAEWSEFDLSKATWTIPAGRMKGGKEHKILLSAQAVAMLKALPREGQIVFPGLRPGIPLSNMSMSSVLKRMDRAVTVHGFRASFRTWAADTSREADPVIEACLAHVVSDQVINAYRRTDFYERRAKLMQAWADYLNG